MKHLAGRAGLEIPDDIVEWIVRPLLEWIPTHNPSNSRHQCIGLNMYGPTVIGAFSADAVMRSLIPLRNRIDADPNRLLLAGREHSRPVVLKKVNELIALPEQVKTGMDCVLHLGI